MHCEAHAIGLDFSLVKTSHLFVHIVYVMLTVIMLQLTHSYHRQKQNVHAIALNIHINHNKLYYNRGPSTGGLHNNKTKFYGNKGFTSTCRYVIHYKLKQAYQRVETHIYL